jgi:hypothetical protein
MKVDMSPKAIENRLKLVGELTRACLLLRLNSSEKQTPSKKSANIDESLRSASLKSRPRRVE